MAKRMWRGRRAGAVILAMAAAALPLAINAAAVTVQADNVGGLTDDNVLFSGCIGAQQVDGTMVQGCLNGDKATLVDFQSTESLHVNGGQAKRVLRCHAPDDLTQLDGDRGTSWAGLQAPQQPKAPLGATGRASRGVLRPTNSLTRAPQAGPIARDRVSAEHSSPTRSSSRLVRGDHGLINTHCTFLL